MTHLSQLVRLQFGTGYSNNPIITEVICVQFHITVFLLFAVLRNNVSRYDGARLHFTLFMKTAKTERTCRNHEIRPITERVIDTKKSIVWFPVFGKVLGIWVE